MNDNPLLDREPLGFVLIAIAARRGLIIDNIYIYIRPDVVVCPRLIKAKQDDPIHASLDALIEHKS